MTTMYRPRAKTTPLPKWFRPRMPGAERLRCKFAHINLIELFTNGRANKQNMIDWICNAFTYSQMMLLLGEDGVEFSDEAYAVFAEQLNIVPAVIDRYRLTGKVGFNGPELEIARTAAGLMDEVIDMDRHGIAEQASAWAVAQLQRIQLGPRPEVVS